MRNWKKTEKGKSRALLDCFKRRMKKKGLVIAFSAKDFYKFFFGARKCFLCKRGFVSSEALAEKLNYRNKSSVGSRSARRSLWVDVGRLKRGKTKQLILGDTIRCVHFGCNCRSTGTKKGNKQWNK